MFVAHARRVLEVEFQENTSNGSRNTAEELVCSPRKVNVHTFKGTQVLYRPYGPQGK